MTTDKILFLPLLHSLEGGGEADGSYSRGFLHTSPPSINTALPIRRLNFVILFVSFVMADPVLFLFIWGRGGGGRGGVKK